MNALIAIAVIVFVIMTFAPYIAGAVMARRAWKRNGWPEARLAYRAFVAGPVITITAAIAYPLVSWQSGNILSIDTLSLISIIAATANAVVMITIAVSLYRLAGRSAQPTQDDTGGILRHPASPYTSGGPGFAKPDLW